MHATAIVGMHMLAAPTVNSTVGANFVQRLQADGLRDSLSVMIGLVIVGAVWSKLNGSLALVSGVGAAWFTWYIYNDVSGKTTPLFTSAGGPSHQFGIGLTDAATVIAELVAIIAGFIVAYKAKTGDNKAHLLVRGMAGAGMWGGIMLIFSLVWTQVNLSNGLNSLLGQLSNIHLPSI